MSAALINTLHAGMEPETDCAICALACFLDRSYTDVLRLAAAHDREAARKGLSTAAIKRVAAELGTPLLAVRSFDPDDDYGIVVTHNHAAVLRRGLVLDRDQVWPWAEWRKRRPGRAFLLMAVGE